MTVRKCTTMVPFALAEFFPQKWCISGLHPLLQEAKVKRSTSGPPDRRPGAGGRLAGRPHRARPRTPRPRTRATPRTGAHSRRPPSSVAAPRRTTRNATAAAGRQRPARTPPSRTTPSSRPTASPSWATRPAPPGPDTVRHASTRLAALEQHRGRTPAARTPPVDDRRLRRNERAVDLGVRQLAAQLPVEAVQQRMHACTPGGDLVELLLQLGPEPHVSDLREMLPQPRADQPPQRRHDEHAAVEQHVTALDQRLERVRIGRRATDAGRLQLGHQRRLGVARRRLRPRRGDLRAALPGAQTVPAARSGTAGGSSASEAGGSTR